MPKKQEPLKLFIFKTLSGHDVRTSTVIESSVKLALMHVLSKHAETKPLNNKKRSKNVNKQDVVELLINGDCDVCVKYCEEYTLNILRERLIVCECKYTETQTEHSKYLIVGPIDETTLNIMFGNFDNTRTFLDHYNYVTN